MMKTDIELLASGFRALLNTHSIVDAERFVTLIQREHFDYTQWRKKQWNDVSVAELASQARQLRKSNEKK